MLAKLLVFIDGVRKEGGEAGFSLETRKAKAGIIFHKPGWITALFGWKKVGLGESFH